MDTVVVVAGDRRLTSHVLAKNCPTEALQNVQFLNTVIGKMSGVITEPATLARLNLTTMTPTTPKAVLVEEFKQQYPTWDQPGRVQAAVAAVYKEVP